MAFREFTDSGGVEWTVYDVIPRSDDRREKDRRGDGIASELSEAERRLDDRRIAIGEGRPVRLTSGWLCFETPTDRRRLQPIPEGWRMLSDSDLAELLAQARVAPQRKMPESAGTGQR